MVTAATFEVFSSDMELMATVDSAAIERCHPHRKFSWAVLFQKVDCEE